MNQISQNLRVNYPGCFQNALQYEQWRIQALKAGVGSSDYCTYCTGAYQHQMIMQSRCEHPNTRFVVDSEGYSQGRRPVNERLVNCKSKGRR